MKVKISKWGNSLGLRLPKAAVAAIGIEAGAQLDLVVVGNELRLRPVSQIPVYKLKDLLVEMDRLGPKNRPQFVNWGPDVGAEMIDDDYSREFVAARGGRSRVGGSATDARKRAGRRQTRRRTHRS